MKTAFFCLSILLLPGAVFSATTPAAPETKAQREQNTPPDMVDQIDTTDIFAVPMDSSEEEENVMNKKLEQMQKKTPKPNGL